MLSTVRYLGVVAVVVFNRYFMLRLEHSFWIVFFSEGYEKTVGKHIKFGGTYEDALDCANLHFKHGEYKDAINFEIFTEKQYKINFL